MARTKLTTARIADFVCPENAAQAFLWDTEAPGLAVRATPGDGRKAYVFQGRLNGKALRITIGDVRAWEIETNDPKRHGARQEARRLKGLLDKGVDPREQEAERAAAHAARQVERARRDVPAREAWNAYIAARRPKWGARHLADHEALARPGGEKKKRGETKTNVGPLAPLLALPLRELTAARLKEWLDAETATRPTQARLAFSNLRAFVNWCERAPGYRGIVAAGTCTDRDLCEALPTIRPKSDCLGREQLKAWFSAVRAIPNPAQAAYLQALLLTGARRNELAPLQWAHVDFKWGSMTIHDKVEGERTIPLTPYVASLLHNLKRRNVRPLRLPAGEKWEPSPLVFAAASGKSGHIVEPRIAHNRALATAGIEGLTLHGLRRSFGTLSEWVECPVGVVAQIMGHKPSALAEKHYRQRPLDLLRLWHRRIESWILNEAGIKFDAAEQEQHPALEVAHG